MSDMIKFILKTILVTITIIGLAAASIALTIDTFIVLSILVAMMVISILIVGRNTESDEEKGEEKDNL